MTESEAIEILEDIYSDLSIFDRLGKKGEAIAMAIVALKEGMSDDHE